MAWNNENRGCFDKTVRLCLMPVNKDFKILTQLSRTRGFYCETVLKYKTKDGYTGYLVKVRNKEKK